MAKTAVIVTRPDIGKMAKAICLLFDMPRLVNHIGSGAVVDPDPTTATRARCWVTRPFAFYRKPSNDGSATDEFGFVVTAEMQALWAERKDVLFTATQKTWITSHLANTADIDMAAWKDADGNFVTGDVDLVALV